MRFHQNSHWYKTLNREPEKITDMINEMKERYGLRPTDKISNIVNTFSLISKFMDEEQSRKTKSNVNCGGGRLI